MMGISFPLGKIILGRVPVVFARTVKPLDLSADAINLVTLDLPRVPFT
jgi:hypothetical protein